MLEQQQNIKITISIRDRDKNIPCTTILGHTVVPNYATNTYQYLQYWELYIFTQSTLRAE